MNVTHFPGYSEGLLDDFFNPDIFLGLISNEFQLSNVPKIPKLFSKMAASKQFVLTFPSLT